MKPDIKLTVILSMVVIVLTFLSHAVDNLSMDLEVLDFALTIPMVLLAISIPAILTYRRRKKWVILSISYIALGTPMTVAAAICGMNLGQLKTEIFVADFQSLIPRVYGAICTVSLILVCFTALFKGLRRRGNAVGFNEGSNQAELTTQDATRASS